VCCSCSDAELFCILCVLLLFGCCVLRISFLDIGQIRSELLIFFAASVFGAKCPLLFFGQESYFRSVSPARLVFFWQFCCLRRRFSRVDAPAHVQGSRPAACSSKFQIAPARSERVRSSPQSQIGAQETAPWFSRSLASLTGQVRPSVLPVLVVFGSRDSVLLKIWSVFMH
jgi:hypothetical protein